MAEQNFDQKFKEMQKFVPFVEKVIEKLQSPNIQEKTNPRQAQLQKMEMLHSLLTNRGKTLKMDTLLKCEIVLIRLRAKMEKQSQFLQNNIEPSQNPVTSINLKQAASNDDILDITGPASPPPQPIIEEVQPVVIPTERRYSPLRSIDLPHNEEQSLNSEDQSLPDRSHVRPRNRWAYTGMTSGQNRLSPAHSNSSSSSNAMNYRGMPETKKKTCFPEHQNAAWQDRNYSTAAKRSSQCNSNGDQGREPYVPEESWDDLDKIDTQKAKDLANNDLGNSLSPSLQAIEIDHDTIFNFRKLPNKMDRNMSSTIFSHLGEKIDDNDPQQKTTIQHNTPSKSAVVSIPVKVPTIPEVLKSPPLSETDITNLLSESMESDCDGILKIGTRRIPKNEPSVVDKSTLDMVRKKFAMITKNTANCVDSPSSTAPFASEPQKSVPGERLALKYNPHRRVERTSISSNDSLGDGRGNLLHDKLLPKTVVNVLPSINQQDPRLRKSAPITSFYPVPIDQSRRTDPRFVSGSSHPAPFETIRHDRGFHDQRITGSSTMTSQFVADNQYQQGLIAARPPQQLNNLSATNAGSTATQMKPLHPGSFWSDGNWEYGAAVCKATSKSNPNTHNNNSHTQNSDNLPSNPSAGHSSEEDWDSEFNNNALTLKSQQQQSISNSASISQNNCNKPFSGNSQLGQTVFNRLPESKKVQTFSNTQQSVSYTASSCSSVLSGNPIKKTRFNAVLNDKSERIKYFEAKKQKHFQARTYGQFKHFKALAAAREAGEDTVKKPTKVMSEPVLKSNVTNTANPKTLKSVPVSSLDKLYRSSNYTNSVLPKPNIAFKIPKKQTSQIGVIKECKGISKANTDTAKAGNNNADKSIDPKEVSDVPKDDTKHAQKTSSKNNTDGAKEGSKNAEYAVDKKATTGIYKQGTKNLNTTTIQNKVNDSKNKNKHKESITIANKGQQQANEPILKISNELNQNKEAEDINENNVLIKNTHSTAKKLLTKESQANNSESTNEHQTKVLDKKHISHALENIEKIDIQLPESTIDKHLEVVTPNGNVDPTDDIAKDDAKLKEVRGPVLLSDKENKEVVVNIKLSSSVKDRSEENKELREATKQVVETPGNIVQPNIETTILNNLEAPPNVVLNFPAKRILQRRSTMFVFNSAPEIDKLKVHSTNALLFEDLQQREATRKRMEEDAKQATRRNKSLSDMFQKTDDNCSVSTQNIITGKRRTRTTVNFNEVQRTLEIFNYKKPVETKKDAKNVPKNSLAEEKMKVPVNTIKKNTKKNTSCNKNSTLTATIETTIAEESSENKRPIGGKNRKCAAGDDNQPSCSKKASIDASAAKCAAAEDNQPSCSKTASANASAEKDEEGNHELVEGFVNDILKPNANTDYIFDLLKQILSDEKLQLVKKIIESATKENAEQSITHDDDNTEFGNKFSVPHEDGNGTKVENKNMTTKIHQPKKKNRGGYKKRNELDRLNDDIRDMFISQGVLTATGRRMCTLVTAARTEKTKTKNRIINDQEVTETKNNDTNKCDIAKTLTNRKVPKAKEHAVKVVHQPLRRSLRSKPRTESENSTPDSNEECAPHSNKTPVTATEGKINVKLLTTSPQMPIVEQHTQIKLSDAEEIENSKEPKPKTMRLEVKLPKMKPLPMCKKSADVEGNGQISIDTDSDSELNKELSLPKKQLVLTKDVVKNTNLNWHSQSKYAKWCILCEVKKAFPAAHYKSHHDEHYSSRLAPTILQQFKQGKLNKPIFGVMTKRYVSWFFRCPFCLQQNRNTISAWLEHFVTHTGEYNYECNGCHKVSNKSTYIEHHIKQRCKGSEILRHNTFNCGKGPKTVKAHVCHLCNFLQLKRENLENHYLKQHDMTKEKIDVMGYSIDLFDTKGVQQVNAKKATIMEAKAIEQYNRDSMVIVDDDEDSIDEMLAELDHNPTFQINLKKNENKTKKVKNQVQIIEVAGSTINSSQEEFQNKPKKVYRKKRKSVLTTNSAPVNDNLTQCVEKSVDLPELKEPDTELPSAMQKTSLVDNSNAFMPTREANNSPNEESFAQSLLNIQQEAQTNVPNVVIIPKTSISIAERLSQRFKDMQESPSSLAPLSGETEVSKVIEVESIMPNSIADTEVNSIRENSPHNSSEKMECQVNEGIKSESSANSVIVVEDDEDWEDIEITESAPSKISSIVSPLAGGSINNTDKQKQKKMINQFSRLFKSKNRTSAGSKKKPLLHSEKVNDSEIELDKSGKTDTIKGSSVRPMLPNLLDLLPDSPCNDPIELVPELTPMEPLQDLNDISSILDSNLNALDTQNQLNVETPNSISIDAENQQTSIQEALEFVMEQQQFDRDIQLTPIKRVSNVGYYKKPNENAVKFYCLFEPCAFLFSSEAIGLESHYKTEHPLIKWNGSCIICRTDGIEMPCVDREFTLSEEIKHMVEYHVTSNSTNKSKPRSPSANAYEERPRIKIRRLSGDCLSITTATTLPLVLNENTKLCDLLNAKPRPPTKQMPPQLNLQLTDPLFRVNEPKSIEPLFTSVGSDFAITSVTSAATFDEQTSARLICLVNKDTTPAKSPSKQNRDTSCGIQITNVTSLADSAYVLPEESIMVARTSSSMPKISDVCSLSCRTSGAAGSLWAKQITTPRLELEKSAKKSVEMPPLSFNLQKAKSQKVNVSDNAVSQQRRDNDSPGPTVIAETLPVAQATSGAFVITQTVSAQYERNGELLPNTEFGFNISIAPTNTQNEASGSTSVGTLPPSAISQKGLENTGERAQLKCMGKSCTYQTRLIVAMNEHLRFHERRNFSINREYLTCCYCNYFAGDVDLYIDHLKKQHNLGWTVDDGICAKPPKKKSHREQLEETIQEMVSETGISESKLYRCVVAGCNSQSLTESSFHTHLVYHLTTLGTHKLNNYTFKCPHCTAVYQRPSGIKAHIKSHMRHRYFCYLCMATASNPEQIMRHFTETHWRVINMHTTQLLKPQQKNSDVDAPVYYVANVQPLTDKEVQQFGEKLIVQWNREKTGSKTHFKPSEIELLPTHPIFKQQVYCTDCPYMTKVRSNMIRHMQMHICTPGGTQPILANIDPVNPVPCLNTSERHFDKMTNLASSSQVPQQSQGSGSASNFNRPLYKLNYSYILETKRFRCGVVGCQYLTITDDIFRSHLSALHSGLQKYSCPFCKEELCKRGLSVDRIIQHLRFHGQKLFRCEECDYLHFMKNVVERHIQDKHATLCVNVVTHLRVNEGETEGHTTVKLTKGKKYVSAKSGNPASVSAVTPLSTASIKVSSKITPKFQCNVCSYKALTLPLIVGHCQSQHGCKDQYQCVHCLNFSAAQLSQVMYHISEKHDGLKRQARVLFKINDQNDVSDAADTRPLWQRDDPKRIRHIRGILMEDEEESEQYRKRFCLDDDVEDDVDVDVEDHDYAAAQTNANQEYLNCDFGCLHCNYKSANFNTLRESHWHNKHGPSNSVLSRPFHFRLLPRLKCGICHGFTGTSGELQSHLQRLHKVRTYCAVDARFNNYTCGYCEFVSVDAATLQKHHYREGHQPEDNKRLMQDHLARFMELGQTETVVQCTSCSALCANDQAYVTHTCTANVDEVLPATYRTLNGVMIYRCPLCMFASTTELTTLRHLINHYEKFKRCHFCHLPQATFNGYMQHCYSDHREEIKRFSEIYPLRDIKKFLQQMLVIFPNGLVINLRNLTYTAYGNDARIRQLYVEICKTAKEPPIPRLSIARLVARKSIEAKQTIVLPSTSSTSQYKSNLPSTSTAAAIQLAGSHKQSLQPKKICKRRSTVAWGVCERNMDTSAPVRLTPFALPTSIAAKKCKMDEVQPKSTMPPLAPRPAVASFPTEGLPPPSPLKHGLDNEKSKSQDGPKDEEPKNLHANAVIAGVQEPQQIDEFGSMWNMNARVVLDKINKEQDDKEEPFAHVKKPCPASHKHKYA